MSRTKCHQPVLHPPDSFAHPDPLHPYSSIWHPLTPVRWILYAATAVALWGGVLPLLLLTSALRWVGRLLLQGWDRLLPPQVCISGDPNSPQMQCWRTINDIEERTHPVGAQDLIWLVPRDAAADATASPGAHSSAVIHAVLALSSPVTLAVVQDRARHCMLNSDALERMNWRAVRRRTRRRWLPSFLGGETEELVWLENLTACAGVDLDRHVRLVPHYEWTAYGGFDGAAAPRTQITWSPLVHSFCSAAADSDSSNGIRDRDLEAAASHSLPPPEIDHPQVLRTAQLQSYVSHLSTMPLASNQPLWELLLLESEPDDPSPQRIVVFRVSHAVADGVLLSGLILQTFMGGGQEHKVTSPSIGSALSRSPEAVELREASPATTAGEEVAKLLPSSQAPMAQPAVQHATVVDTAAVPNPRPRVSCSQRFCGTLRAAYSWWLLLATGPYLLLQKSFQPDDFNALTRGRYCATAASSAGAVVEKQVCWSMAPVPLSAVKRCSKALGVSLNDLLMSIWLDVFNEYMQAVEELENGRAAAAVPMTSTAASRLAALGSRAPERMFVIVPFNVRPSSDRPPPTPEVPHGNVERLSARSRQLGNKYAVLLVDVPMSDKELRRSQPRNRGSMVAAIAASDASIVPAEEQRSLVLSKHGDADDAGGSAAVPSLVPLSSFAESPFLLRLHALSSVMSLLKSGDSLEALMMYGIIALLLGYLPQSLALYFLDIYGGLASAVLTNNRSADGRLIFRIDKEEEQRQWMRQQQQQEHKESHQDMEASSSSPSLAAAAAPDDVVASKPLSPCFLDYWVSWAPQRNDAGICVTLLTYAGELRVSIVAERRCLRYASAQELVERYERKLAALIAQTDALTAS